jgi:amino acid transporter
MGGRSRRGSSPTTSTTCHPTSASNDRAGATISAFAAALAAATGASRILFALARDAFESNPVGRASARSGAPAGALVVILGIALVALVAYRVNGTEAVNAFFYPGTMGVLLMLVSYLVCNTGAIVFLYLRGQRRAPILELPIPIIALGIICYVLYQNTLSDDLEYPYTVFPLVVAGWLVVGLLLAVLVPGLARRIGQGLAREEGIEVAGSVE